MLPSAFVSPSVGKKSISGRGSEPSRLFEVVVAVFPPLLITTVLPELLIELLEVAVFTLLELLLLMTTLLLVMVVVCAPIEP